MSQLTIPDRWRAASGAGGLASTFCRASKASFQLLDLRSHFKHGPVLCSATFTTRQLLPATNSSHGSWVPSQSYSAVKDVFKRCYVIAASGAGTAPVPSAGGNVQAVIDGLDALNSKDPRSVEVEGQQVPYELAYARWLTAWMERLCTDAGRSPSDELRIAARGQHVERWKVPRSSYPEGRAAYLQWREDLKRQHAATTTGLMAAAGYPPESCKRVEQLILKRALKETEGQILEDALCLVFLERQFAEFVPKLAEGAGGDVAEAEAKTVDILQKSWKKMGPLGRAAALKLPLEPRLAELVGRALAPPPTK